VHDHGRDFACELKEESWVSASDLFPLWAIWSRNLSAIRVAAGIRSCREGPLGRTFAVPDPLLEVRSPALLPRSQATHDRRHQW